jgi:hypothetical protein
LKKSRVVRLSVVNAICCDIIYDNRVNDIVVMRYVIDDRLIELKDNNGR